MDCFDVTSYVIVSHCTRNFKWQVAFQRTPAPAEEQSAEITLTTERHFWQHGQCAHWQIMFKMTIDIHDGNLQCENRWNAIAKIAVTNINGCFEHHSSVLTKTSAAFKSSLITAGMLSKTNQNVLLCLGPLGF